MPNSIRYDVDLIREDMAENGWLATDLARHADLTDETVSQFLKGNIQTARSAKKIAQALRRRVRRYIVSARGAAA